MQKSDMTNRRRIGYILMFLMIIAMIGGVVFMRSSLSKIAADTETEISKYNRHYVMIASSTEKDFWDSVYSGAEEEAKKSDVYVERLEDNLISSFSKEELLRIAIDASVDGIILEGDETDEIKQLIDEANQHGIPVVTVRDDCSTSKRISFVGVSGYTLGKTYGDFLLRHLGNDVKTIYVLMDSNRADLGQALAVSGIQDAVRDSYSEHYGLTIEGVPIENNGAFGAEESIRDFFLNDEILPDVMVCLSSVFTKCAFQAAVDYNKVGELSILGYYNSEPILEAVSKNILQSTVSIDTNDMGRKSIQALEEYLTTGYVSNYLAVDTQMIDQGQAINLLNEHEIEEQ